MKLKKWQMLMCVVLAGAGIFWTYDFMKNNRAHQVKTKVFEEVNADIRAEKTLTLTHVGDIPWDYVCIASYEARGIDVSDGVYIAQRGLNKQKLDFSGFSIANEDYNELSRDWMYGVVFVSVSQRLLVAISLHDTLGVSVFKDECSQANNASLRSTGSKENGYQVTFIGRML